MHQCSKLVWIEAKGHKPNCFVLALGICWTTMLKGTKRVWCEQSLKALFTPWCFPNHRKMRDALAIPVTFNSTQIVVRFFYDCCETNCGKIVQIKSWDACRPKEEVATIWVPLKITGIAGASHILQRFRIAIPLVFWNAMVWTETKIHLSMPKSSYIT